MQLVFFKLQTDNLFNLSQLVGWQG